MDPISRVVAAGAAGAGGAAGAALYVDDVFSTFLYEGNQSTLTITNGVDLAGEGGLVWLKSRTNGATNLLIDTERGAKETLKSNETDAEVLDSNSLTTFNSDGFDLGGDTKINYNGADHVSWTFRKAPGFFDVVTWTGDGTDNRALSHSLGSTPGFIAIKATSSTGNWICWHRDLTTNYSILLNTTGAEQGYNRISSIGASSFSVRDISTNVGSTNASGVSYVAYLFAHDDQSFGTNSDEAIIKCGSYTATGSAQTIDLGFEPQFLITKKSSGTGEWRINDMMRGIVAGGADAQLDADSNSAETTGNVTCDLTPEGFITNGSQNDSGGTYIYIAIRRPHKPPSAGTDVFSADSQESSGIVFRPGFVTDFGIKLFTAGGSTTYSQMALTRLTGDGFLATSQTNAESTAVSNAGNWDNMIGWGDLGGLGYGLSFKRAAGFFDVVAYTGTGSDLTLNHNLGAVPELIICRNRSSGTGRWYVYPGPLSSSEQKHFRLNEDIAVSSSASLDWAPTATTFNADTFLSLSTSGTTYIAYLFATLSGISKVGSYSGTGNNVDVNCGFAAGARFVLIKRTDSTGDWYVWDSTRGIVSGNDPYILLNTTAAQVTTTDYLDPLNAGFTVTSSAPAALNTSGGTYLFLAIA